jgi:RNA polymerase sigma-70 factor (ECF subfamily)
VPTVTAAPEGEELDLTDAIPDHAPVANPEQLLLGREVGTRIDRAMRRLTPRERVVFELKHYEGLRLRTIGEILQMSEETAKNTLFRGTQKLRTALADLAGASRPSRQRTQLGSAEAE